MSDPYVGEIKAVPYDFPPKNWAFCDGQLVSRTQYASLFQIIGTAYGAGDGVTTFALPDLQERFPIHYGAASGLTAYNLGDSGGQAGISLSADEAAHTHTLAAVPDAATLAGPGGAAMAQASSSLGNIYHSATNMVAMNANSVLPTGNNLPHENRTPYTTIAFIISLEGIYPSQ